MRCREESWDRKACRSFCQDSPVYWAGKGDGSWKGYWKDRWNIGLKESLGYCWGWKTCLDLENCWKDCLGLETCNHGGVEDCGSWEGRGNLENSGGW